MSVSVYIRVCVRVLFVIKRAREIAGNSEIPTAVLSGRIRALPHASLVIETDHNYILYYVPRIFSPVRRQTLLISGQGNLFNGTLEIKRDTEREQVSTDSA